MQAIQHHPTMPRLWEGKPPVMAFDPVRKAAGCGVQGPGKEAFDCNAALGNWCRAWSPSKKVWCCNNQQRPDSM